MKRMIVDSLGVYEGEVNSAGKPHGYGVRENDNNSKYEGEYKNGKMHGHGVFTYYDGNVYDGEWVNGKCEGHGIYKYPDGNYFEGEFKNDERNGYGIYTRTDGCKMLELYDNGELKHREPFKGDTAEFFASVKASSAPEQTAPPPVARTVSRYMPTSDESKALSGVLSDIAKRYGIECFRKGGKANSFLTDMLPGDTNANQRRRVKNAMDSGACDLLIDSKLLPDDRRKEALDRLIKYSDMAEDIAGEIIKTLADILI